MKTTTDSVVWDYAKENDFMIVSKDADMHDRPLYFCQLSLKNKSITQQFGQNLIGNERIRVTALFETKMIDDKSSFQGFKRKMSEPLITKTK